MGDTEGGCSTNAAGHQQPKASPFIPLGSELAWSAHYWVLWGCPVWLSAPFPPSASSPRGGAGHGLCGGGGHGWQVHGPHFALRLSRCSPRGGGEDGGGCAGGWRSLTPSPLVWEAGSRLQGPLRYRSPAESNTRAGAVCERTPSPAASLRARL